ncbi:GyrI-like domain-containing protein [Chachezhania sediminis]|uniref:GyrI-like domain-containing protein n=1 Tax=Chachezhania sediminis TaxID=2599291 RepID=UPI00131C6C79|nr:GyrI-like domain-containing protein [Chachezhania sediminis]
MTIRAEVEIVVRAERHAVGTVRAYTMQTRDLIGVQWRDFFDAGYEIPHRVGAGSLGISFAADGLGGFRYAVAQEVSQVPATLADGLCDVVLSAGNYAVLRAKGPMAGLPDSFDWMFSDWLPRADVVQREGAVFEYYPPASDPAALDMDYEIWVPVRAGP